MTVQIGDYTVKTDKTVSIHFKDKRIVVIIGSATDYAYFNPNAVDYIHIEK